MHFFFEDPRWLWLGALAAPLVIVAWRTFDTMTGLRRGVSVAARILLFFLLAAMLAGLSTRRETNKLAVIAVVDRSGSVDRFFPGGGERSAAAVRSFLNEATAERGAEDLVGVVSFDGGPAVTAGASRADGWERQLTPRGVPGTDIAQALQLASAIVPPDAAGRVVLFSDGNQTSGDALEAARAIAARAGMARGGRLPIDVVPLSYALRNEVVVEGVDAPPGAPARSTISVRVLLRSTGPAAGSLRLLREGVDIDLNGDEPGVTRPVALRAGRTVEEVEVTLPAGRVHRFRAVFEPDVAGVDEARGRTTLAGDTVTENNEGGAFTIAPDTGTVLLVTNDPEPALGAVLERAGIVVQRTPPDTVPADALALQAFDMVILDNVPADAIGPDVQTLLTSFVRDLGGGLAMVGGPNSFGAGGWKGSRIAEVLPVHLDLPDRVVAPEVATLFIIDNSGSMRRPVLGSPRNQQEIANEATALAIESLDKNDLVGVITFNSSAGVLAELSRNDNAAETARRVRGIGSGGGTDLAEGLERGISQMRGALAKTKQVVILTDGKSQRTEDLPRLVDQLRTMDCKVSTIAVGDDADLATLADLARRGNGAFYHAADPQSLPKVFLKAVRVQRSPLIREGDFRPVTLASGSPITRGLGAVPALGGLVITRPREEPTVTVAMAAPTGEPVLAHWSVGLGQVVAFTSDAGSRWAAGWLGWPGYEAMWLQLVRSAARPAGASPMRADLAPVGGRALRLRLYAADEAGDPVGGASATATVYAPDGTTSELALSPAGAGVFEVLLNADKPGSYIAAVKPRAPGRRIAPVIVGASVQEGDEYRTLASDETLLARVAEATGGRVLSLTRATGAGLFDRRGIAPATAVTPLWKPLMIAALVALLLDIASRRVAWDRYFSRRFRGDLAAQALAIERAAQAAVGARIGSLRDRIERVEDSHAAAPALALSDGDAHALAAAARDRRLRQRLGDVTPAPTPAQDSISPNSEPRPDRLETEESGGLLAAKRRAARRFDDR
ncbi:MAG TPA: VWA domain-containing protein [Phycisphaerales bacterium]|nr:VWA domain-containing protein [Phycisphaerales bacterium]